MHSLLTDCKYIYTRAIATGSCSSSRFVYTKLNAHDLANMGQASVDWIGVGHIVQDFLLPVLLVMCLFSLLAPIFGHSRVLKCHTPAGHVTC